MVDFPYHRVVVIGATGAGKTFLAEKIATRWNIPHIELDALHWEPGWVDASDEEFRRRVAEAISVPAWVVDGNYGVCRDLVWSHADLILWLDYPLWTVFWRLWNRIWRRWWRQELLWGNNRERLLIHFKLWSDESLIKWLFKTYRRRKREYPILLSSDEYSHLNLFRFKSPRAAEDWVSSLKGVA